MTKTKKIDILIVDDHKLVRDGIRYTLTAVNVADSFGRIDEAVNGAEAVMKAGRYAYDVILMDIKMPEMDGASATAEIRKKNKKVRVIALTMYSEGFEIKNMLKAGVQGYLLKNTSSEELIKALKTIMKGERYYSNEVALKLIEPFHDEIVGGTDFQSIKKDILSKREKQILKLITSEFTNDQISKKLSLSKKTVDCHRQNIINKIGVKNTAGLVKYAIKIGLI